MQQASGTAANPAAAPMQMLMTNAGSWHLMAHAYATFDSLRETGPRGHDKNFSTNWGMFSAQRAAGRGAIQFRSMLSLEPATISNRQYPELFQTGETAFGKPIIDGQHPHDFFMELSAEYARPFAGSGMLFVYVAPVGDPALGPVAFPHRESAMEIPQAVIGHHFEDSTHISYNVITAGVQLGMWRLEGSSFHGAEPDEDRWDIDGGRLDSASGRLTFTPTPNLNAQLSAGYLTKPEKLEPGDAKRGTASVSYTLAGWSSTLLFGRVYKESHDIWLNAWLAESTLRLARRHVVAVRVENGDKDELFPHFHRTNKVERPALPVPIFRVTAATLGYTVDFWIRDPLRLGLGADTTWYRFPEILQGFYGQKPRSQMIYFRARIGSM